MAKRPTTTTIGSGFFGTTQLNNNFDAIDTAFDNTLSRDGSSPNSMSADIDMNNNDILNVSSLQTTGLTLNGVGVTPTSVAATPAAASITITDAGGYYTAADVEGALQEIAAGYQPLDAQLTALAATSITGVSGADTSLITGTAGTAGNVAAWNADGDLVDGGYAAGAMVFIQSQDASNNATLDFTGFDASKYDAYRFVVSNLVPATDATALRIRTSTDGGSTYDSGASDYQYALTTVSMSTGTGANSFSPGADRIPFGGTVGSAAGEDGVSLEITVAGPHLAKQTKVFWQGSYHGADGVEYSTSGSGKRASAADVDALRFLFSSGNIESGTITMYGLRNS